MHEPDRGGRAWNATKKSCGPSRAKRVENRQGFIIHSMLFVVVNLALFAIWRVTDSESERRAIDRELERLHHPRI